MDNLLPYEKGLFTQLMNYSSSNEIKFIFSSEKFVLLVSENNDAKCIKKNDDGWEIKHFNEEDALRIFNLVYMKKDDADNASEISEDNNENEVDRINGILNLNARNF